MLGYAKHIGRVGALAVALGVGTAVTCGHGIAIADSESGPSGTSSSGSSGSSTGSSATGDRDTGESSGAAGSSAARESSGGSGSTGTSATGSQLGTGQSSATDTSTTGASATDTSTTGESSTGQDSDADTSGTGTSAAGASTEGTSTVDTSGTDTSTAGASTEGASTAGEGVTVGTTGIGTSTAGGSPTGISTEGASTAGEGLAVGTTGTGASAFEGSPIGISTVDISTVGEDLTTTSSAARHSTAGPSTAAVTTSDPLPVAVTTHAPPIVAGNPVSFSVNLVSAFAAVLFTPFAAPGPTTPTAPNPLAELVWAFFRRIENTFFNSTPTANPTQTAQSATGVVTGSLGAADANGDPLTYTVTQQPAKGSVVVNPDGTYTYTPNAAFAAGGGVDSFTVITSEANAWQHFHGPAGLLAKLVNAFSFGLINLPDGSAVQTVVPVTVVPVATAPVNAAPVANADNFTTNEDTVVVGNVLANDTDSDTRRSALTASLVAGPTKGSVVLNADGSFTYTPNSNVNGADSFTYRVDDGAAVNNLSDVATVSITIAAVNDAPAALNEAYTTVEDTALVVDAANGVLANDTDIDSPRSAVIAALAGGVPTKGSVVLNADGSFAYTPFANATGQDSFSYRAVDGNRTSNVGTVTITITAVNDAPVAVPDAYTTGQDSVLSVDAADGVLGNVTDVDHPRTSLTASLVTGPSRGSVVLNADGSFVYTPNAGVNGADSFTYRASDGLANSNTATITINVTPAAGAPVNAAPVANGDGFVTIEDTVVVGNVLANDTDSDTRRSALTASLVTGPAKGSVVLNADGSFTYVPNANVSGADAFTYRVDDGAAVNNLSDVATVSVTIIAVNDSPVAVNDVYTVDEDTALVVNAANGFLGNDTDIDSPRSALTLALAGGAPAKGNLALNADGSFTYTPFANATGQDSFAYRAVDGGQTSNVGTVTITITAVNDAPVAVPDAYTTGQDSVLSVDAANGVLGNVTDVDHPRTSLTASLVTGPSRGSVVLNADGSFVYTPDAGASGQDAFTYRASDGLANSNTATITINVTPTAPVAGEFAGSSHL